MTTNTTIASQPKAAPSEPSPCRLQITLRQAIRLVEFFGSHDADMTITERPAEWEQPEEGLYAYCTEYPEEGAQFLGATEVDDELARKGMRPAAPALPEPAAAQDETPKSALDIEVLSDMLDRVTGIFSTAMDSAYCPSSDAFKSKRLAFHKAVGTLRRTLEIAAQPLAEVSAAQAVPEAHALAYEWKYSGGEIWHDLVGEFADIGGCDINIRIKPTDTTREA